MRREWAAAAAFLLLLSMPAPAQGWRLSEGVQEVQQLGEPGASPALGDSDRRASMNGFFASKKQEVLEAEGGAPLEEVAPPPAEGQKPKETIAQVRCQGSGDGTGAGRGGRRNRPPAHSSGAARRQAARAFSAASPPAVTVSLPGYVDAGPVAWPTAAAALHGFLPRCRRPRCRRPTPAPSLLLHRCHVRFWMRR